jgi:hypothetical protein
MAEVPNAPILGDNVEITLFIDNVPQPGNEFATSIQLKQEANIHKRGHLGRKRQRIYKQVNGYTASLKMDAGDMRLRDRLAARDAARDANLPVPTLALMVVFTLRTGAQAAYMLTECEDTTDVDAGDREQEVAYNVEIAAENMELVA